MIKVKLGSERLFMTVHWFSLDLRICRNKFYAHVKKGVLTSLEAVETFCALLLLEKDVFGPHYAVFEIGQHLNAELIFSVHCQI